MSIAKKPTLIVLITFLLIACSTTEKSHFYLLDPIEHPADPIENQVFNGITIELRVANLPGYIDRPQIVSRDQNHNVEINEFHRWAEPLQENFTRVLAANISHKISPGELVYQQAFAHNKIDHRLFVTILRFDSDTQTGHVFLKVRWSLQSISDKNILLKATEQIEVPVSNTNFTTRVYGHNQAVFQLATHIAGKLTDQLNH